jgi:predicted dehydrogenase
VVLVATPDFWHAPIVIAAAGAGKDIYCEKGWCRTLLKPRPCARPFRSKGGGVLQLGHNYNSLPTLIKAKEIFQSGQWGKVPLICTSIPLCRKTATDLGESIVDFAQSTA